MSHQKFRVTLTKSSKTECSVVVEVPPQQFGSDTSTLVAKVAQAVTPAMFSGFGPHEHLDEEDSECCPASADAVVDFKLLPAPAGGFDLVANPGSIVSAIANCHFPSIADRLAVFKEHVSEYDNKMNLAERPPSGTDYEVLFTYVTGALVGINRHLLAAKLHADVVSLVRRISYWKSINPRHFACLVVGLESGSVDALVAATKQFLDNGESIGLQIADAHLKPLRDAVEALS